jgi:hypothetical protein
MIEHDNKSTGTTINGAAEGYLGIPEWGEVQVVRCPEGTRLVEPPCVLYEHGLARVRSIFWLRLYWYQ